MALEYTGGWGAPPGYRYRPSPVKSAKAPAKASAPAPVSNPAASTWTPENLQKLANAYSALNPTWTPPADQNAALPNPIQPVQFDPNGDVSYVGVNSAVTNANTHAQAQHDYQVHRGAQGYGYDASGNLITSGSDFNPYSEAMVLKKNYEDSVRGTNNSYAAQGQLYAGSRLNAQAANDYGYGRSSDQLQRSAGDYYHSNDQTLQGVQDQGLFQIAAALGPAFQNFLAMQKGS